MEYPTVCVDAKQEIKSFQIEIQSVCLDKKIIWNRLVRVIMQSCFQFASRGGFG